MTKATFAPSLKSWLESANAPSSDFPIQNLPFGIFNDDANLAPRPGVAIGDRIVDLSALEHAGLLNAQGTLSSPRLNDFVALGQEAWREVRIALSSPLASNNGTLRDNFDLRGRALLPYEKATMHLLSIFLGTQTSTRQKNMRPTLGRCSEIPRTRSCQTGPRYR